MFAGPGMSLCGSSEPLSRLAQDQRGMRAWSAGRAGRRAFSAAIKAERAGASPSATWRSVGALESELPGQVLRASVEVGAALGFPALDLLVVRLDEPAEVAPGLSSERTGGVGGPHRLVGHAPILAVPRTGHRRGCARSYELFGHAPTPTFRQLGAFTLGGMTVH